MPISSMALFIGTSLFLKQLLKLWCDFFFSRRPQLSLTDLHMRSTSSDSRSVKGEPIRSQYALNLSADTRSGQSGGHRFCSSSLFRNPLAAQHALLVLPKRRFK